MAFLRVLCICMTLNFGFSYAFTFNEFFMREKCMTELGCFSAGKPFFDFMERPMSLLPDDRISIDTQFYLFNASSGMTPLTFSNLDLSFYDIDSSGFNPKVKTIFVIPGFMSKFADYWKIPLVKSLLSIEPCNVFLVDWQHGDGPLYEQAVANTRVVGAEIALFLNKLKEKYEFSFESVHLIGHSLGSHIAGYAGKLLHKIGRITALDPAGPYFTNVEPIVRLDKSDALFVDAIHTNAAPNRFQGFGLVESIAHLDFWPNGGHLQPGCPDMGSSIWTFITHPTLDYDGLHDLMCNHGRAIDLFTSSINNPDCEMYGLVCENMESYVEGLCNTRTAKPFLMGIHADIYSKYIDNSRSLNVYLNTTDEVPFCKK
ncbi:pancreatic lipase-related protein 2-like [Parasteatoda tepidariorum]|uniref:pancreatic lipase-related protein 2-like n=1 Tax=Parasteatoda tepidariorum TaxID=114398 RepID=UPI00077FBA79|nr:pancreatic lipase-related protein 2-like [Parasteatoda tepidariorum]